jgi:RHS repeat-associated protein
MDALYIYGPTGRIAKKVNNITEYYHTDHLGSTKAVTSENGTVTEEILYKPFGEQMNVSEEKYTYNGKERDETGLYYYGARYYDPAIGRFVTRDPLIGTKESPQTLNRYVYCINNPLTYVDPTGMQSQDPQQTVEDIFGKLQDINPNELKDIQELLDAGEQLEALMKILDLLGFEYIPMEDGTLSVDLGDDNWYTIKIDNEMGNWGSTNNHPLVKTISIRFSSGKVGDVTLTLLHEICHAALGGTTKEEIIKEHTHIYSVQYSYMLALNDFGVPFSCEDIRKGGRYNYWLHMFGELREYDPEGINRVPVSEILKEWERWRNVH